MSIEWRDKPNVGGDVFIREPGSPEYNREEITLDNSSGEAVVTYPAGYPIDDAGEPVMQGDESTTVALLAQTEILAVGEVRKAATINRGHVVVNQDAMPTVDTADDTFDVGAIATALTDLGFVFREEPSTQSEHTT